jgi:DnaJ-class molecular chaperone
MQSTPPINPGDEAPAGTTGTGESVCARCRGSGKIDSQQTCPDCAGTGKVIEGVGGG